MTQRQIFAFSGILKSENDTRSNSDLTRFALELCGKSEGQRLCYVPTGVGDSPLAVEGKTKASTAGPGQLAADRIAAMGPGGQVGRIRTMGTWGGAVCPC